MLPSSVTAQAAPPRPGARPRPTVLELFRAALFLGLIGFGGGLTVLSSIRSLSVDRRRWLTEREFTNAATVAQMLPGGAAANTLAGLGLRFHGVSGAAVAYLGFVLPGMFSILVLAWAYVRFGMVPHADALLSGLNAAVVGIIVAITLRMASTSVARLWQMGVVAGALLLSLVGNAGSGEVACIGIASGLVWDLGIERTRLLRFRRKRWRAAPRVALPDEGGRLRKVSPEAPTPGPPVPPGLRSAHVFLVMIGSSLPFAQLAGVLLPLAVVFFRVGLGAYGGGFAIIPSLSAEMHLHGWVTERQFADAVAVGKLTPGPVLLMATFLGYVQDGLAGALVATAAILTAPFLLVVLLSSWLARVRSRRWVRAALRGLTPAVVGLMAAAALILGRTLQSGAGVAIAAAVALTLTRFQRINPVVMLILGGITRVVLHEVTGN